MEIEFDANAGFIWLIVSARPWPETVKGVMLPCRRRQDGQIRLGLEAGVVILEGLCLGHVELAVFEPGCLPLPGKAIDGAACRAILRR